MTEAFLVSNRPDLMTNAVPTLTPERQADGDAVDALIDRAFGPGRYAKAAERLREGREPLRDLSFVAWKGDAIIGCVRLYAITIGGTPALLLGPFAVEDAQRSQGLGAKLIRRACDAAAAAGHSVILLVGDEPFFAPLGYARGPALGVIMPGPVDLRRVLAMALKPGAADMLAGKALPAQ